MAQPSCGNGGGSDDGISHVGGSSSGVPNDSNGNHNAKIGTRATFFA
jgi:hypothetical protein